MKEFTIVRNIARAGGWQMFKTSAPNKEKALLQFEAGQDDFLDEEIEVMSLEDCEIGKIEEVK